MNCAANWASRLDHGGIGGENGMEHFEGDLALQSQVAHSVDATEATGAELSQQLVVVPQRSAQALLPRLRILALGEQRWSHRDLELEVTEIGQEIAAHLHRGQIAVAWFRSQRANDQSLEGSGTGGSQLPRRHNLLRIARRLLSGDRQVEQGPGRVHVTGRISHVAASDFGGHERFAVGIDERDEIEAVTGVPQIGDDIPSRSLEHQHVRNEPADDDLV
jgi:hypothetical protein